jgi:hypothetical protein
MILLKRSLVKEKIMILKSEVFLALDTEELKKKINTFLNEHPNITIQGQSHSTDGNYVTRIIFVIIYKENSDEDFVGVL